MYINPNWRILTVGDGDLSFSLSLWQHHQPRQLVATVFDSIEVLTKKYGDQQLTLLQESGCPVLTQFDVTEPKSWQGLHKNSFDVVIFQFPLVPGFRSEDEFLKRCGNASVNTLNRYLLRRYLIHSFEHFLDPNGAQLSLITSKDVKPYRAWDIENSLNQGTQIHYLGSMPFEIERFPGYRIRHVDADRHVKETEGITYAWSVKEESELDEQLHPPAYQEADCCAMCRVGPFGNELDRERHLSSRRHQLMENYQQQWLDYLKNLNSG